MMPVAEFPMRQRLLWRSKFSLAVDSFTNGPSTHGPPHLLVSRGVCLDICLPRELSELSPGYCLNFLLCSVVLIWLQCSRLAAKEWIAKRKPQILLQKQPQEEKKMEMAEMQKSRDGPVE